MATPAKAPAKATLFETVRHLVGQHGVIRVLKAVELAILTDAMDKAERGREDWFALSAVAAKLEAGQHLLAEIDGSL